MNDIDKYRSLITLNTFFALFRIDKNYSNAAVQI